MAVAVQSQNPTRRNVHTREQLIALLDYEPHTGVFRWRNQRGRLRAGSEAGTLHGPGYLKVRVDRKPYYLHRVAWLFMMGGWPENEVDHRNGDRADNRWGNLRAATHAQNNWNKRPAKNGAALKGAYRARGGKWRSQIKQHGTLHWLGNFDTAEQAHAAYCAAAARFHGEFARTE